MPTFTSPVDGTSLFYRYYIPSSSPHKPASDVQCRPLTLIFLHGWAMSSRMFDQLIVPLVESHRYRVIAPDRRGFGNTDWNTPTTGEVTFDTFAADLVALIEHLRPGPFVFVAASMGASESVLAYHASAYARENCRGFVWLGPNMPYPERCPESPTAPSAAEWDALADGFRSSEGKEFVAQQAPVVFRPDLVPVGQRTLQFFERLALQADPIAVERTIVLIRRPMAAELRALVETMGPDKIPILILHGDSDPTTPLEATSVLLHQMLPWSTLNVYKNAGHGLYLTHSAQVMDDLLEFFRRIPEPKV
ncbi:hypothetical protein VTK26DRAFT_8328 [Humicola hyalothermophila]